MSQLNPLELQKYFKNKNVVEFAEIILGMPLHEGQKYWLRNSWKPIDILKPANQWGKTTVVAISHIFQAVCKPQIARFNLSFQDWFNLRYETLNFGKTYEIARGVMELVIDITNGNYLLPDGTMNNSLLKGFAISGISDVPKPPQVAWWNNSLTLIRSYDGLGEAFKRKKLAYVSGDECGDIPELRLFLNGTLLPRVFFYEGSVHLIGTSQSKGVEYEDITAESEEDMRQNGKDANHFVISSNIDPNMAMIYQNKFMPQDRIKQIEMIADPELKKQIIYGQYVDWGKHLYTWDEVAQMFNSNLPWDEQTGFSEQPQADASYAFFVDLAASDDETSCTCLRYNITTKGPDNALITHPHRIVFHKAWKGKTMSLSVQYAMIKEYFRYFKEKSPARTKFGYDAGSLGGKNAGDAFSELHGYPFPPKGRGYAEVKAEGMGKVKEVLGRGRVFVIDERGKIVDKNPNWGGVRASPKLTELRRQLEIASTDDAGIKNDQYSSFMMALHFAEARAPRTHHSGAVDFNILRGT